MAAASFEFVIVTLIWLVVLLAWLATSLVALFALRNRPLGETAKALWALVVIAVPILGAVALWVVDPRGEQG